MTAPLIALVTGANRGIGAEIVKQLAAKGIHVIAAARDITNTNGLLAQCKNDGHSVSTINLDVTNEEDCQAALEYVKSTHGKLDILVNNAGVALDQWVSGLDLDLNVIRQTMEVNVYGPLRLCQLFIPLMQNSGYGRVVNLSSELASMESSEMGSTVAYRSKQFESAFYRPPYGFAFDGTRKAVEEKNKQLAYITLWVNDVNVTKKQSSAFIHRLKKKVQQQNGGSIVLHERIFKNSDSNDKENIDKSWLPKELDNFIPWAKQQGFEFVLY